MRYYIIALIAVILDQWSKWIIEKTMEVGETINIINHFLYITSSRNRGAAWSILQGQFGFFTIVTVVVVIAVIYYMQKIGRFKPILGTALGLVLGGTIGNFIDRMFRGEVVDFINTYIFSYDFPIFNIADSCLTIGAVLIVIYSFLESKKENIDG